ncbi:MAG: 50S ribosomal protein L2 [Candidatus Parcubacteria bacterium]|nr:MAG: 50S ribosomal protein L2 [Candidatus Parcubacteria bacterium]
MALKIVKSRGPGKRVAIFVDYKKVLTAKEPYKPLVVALKKRTARNNQGRITTRFRKNPAHRRLYRLVDFSRLDRKDISAKVETIEYDPNRTAFIMLVCYRDGERRYHLAPEGINVGDEIICSESAPIKIGNRLPLKNIPPGTEIYEVELVPQGKGKLIRSAGSAGVIMGCDEKHATIKMPSGEIRKVSKECYATIGRVSNIDHRNIRLGKAGRKIWKGFRPNVRGSAMNPRDHPYGGGEGRAPRGTRKPKTKWGKITGGRKTRRKRNPYSRLIIKRRK